LDERRPERLFSGSSPKLAKVLTSRISPFAKEKSRHELLIENDSQLVRGEILGNPLQNSGVDSLAQEHDLPAFDAPERKVTKSEHLPFLTTPPEEVKIQPDSPYRCERMRALLLKARAWTEGLQNGSIPSSAWLAEQQNVTRARISQILRLTRLAPEIQSDLLAPSAQPSAPTEHQLRRLAGLAPHLQLSQWERHRPQVPAERRRPSKKARSNRSRHKGFQHLFILARRYEALATSGQYRSLKEVGEVEGVSGEWVGRIVALLQLAPAIIERLDVPCEQLPPGMKWSDIQALTRYSDHAAQLVMFAQLVKECARRSTKVGKGKGRIKGSKRKSRP
jgi:hypothetical protein